MLDRGKWRGEGDRSRFGVSGEGSGSEERPGVAQGLADDKFVSTMSTHNEGR